MVRYLVPFVVCAFLAGQLNGQSYTVGWLDSVEVLFTPDSAPIHDGNLLGGTLSLRVPSRESIVTFSEIEIDNLHQLDLFGETLYGSNVPVELRPYDSHLLLQPEDIGGSAGPFVRESGLAAGIYV